MEDMEGSSGLLLRFGCLYFFGYGYSLYIALEALITVSPVPEDRGICGRNNNLLASLIGLDRILPPVTAEVFSYIFNFLVPFVFVFHLLLIKNHKRLRLLISRARQIKGISRSVSAWACVYLVLLINATSSCFGVLSVDLISITLVGLINFLGYPEDGLAVNRWVIHQSFVSAFLVAALHRKGWPLHTIVALIPVVAALFADLGQKYAPAARRDPWWLPISVSKLSTSDKTSENTATPERDTSTATAAGVSVPSSLHSELAAADVL